MGMSTGRDLHIDRNLTNVAINYRPQGMIADMIAPIVTVQKETDLYPIFSRDEAFAVESTLRSRGAEARKITRSVGSAGYAVKNYALAYDLAIEDRANIDPEYAFELEAGATRYLLDKLSLDWEYRVLSQIGSATNVSTGFVPNSAWNAAANPGDAVAALFTVQETLQGATGQAPNSILFGWRAWNAFRRNSAVRSFVNGSNNGGGAITRQQFMEKFEIPNVLVSQAFFNTANEGQFAAPGATQSALTSLFHDKILMYYAPPAASRDTPSFMYSFRWANPALPTPLAVERHPYDSRRKVEGIEAGYYQDEKITGKDYGALILGVNSAQSNGI